MQLPETESIFLQFCCLKLRAPTDVLLPNNSSRLVSYRSNRRAISTGFAWSRPAPLAPGLSLRMKQIRAISTHQEVGSIHQSISWRSLHRHVADRAFTFRSTCRALTKSPARISGRWLRVVTSALKISTKFALRSVASRRCSAASRHPEARPAARTDKAAPRISACSRLGACLSRPSSSYVDYEEAVGRAAAYEATLCACNCEAQQVATSDAACWGISP